MFVYSKIKTNYEIDQYILQNNTEKRKISCKMRVSGSFLENR